METDGQETEGRQRGRRQRGRATDALTVLKPLVAVFVLWEEAQGGIHTIQCSIEKHVQGLHGGGQSFPHSITL